MTEQNETYTIGEVNEKGRAALEAWLKENLSQDRAWAADRWAEEMIANLDGSFADVQGLSVELSGLKSRTGNPIIYYFGPGEFDLITYSEDGEEIVRRPA